MISYVKILWENLIDILLHKLFLILNLRRGYSMHSDIDTYTIMG